MRQDYLSEFLPEKGYVYFFNNRPKDKDMFIVNNTFLIWSGYFNDFSKILFTNYTYEKMPIEFQMYFDAEYFDDNEINVQKTLDILKEISGKNLQFSTTKECLLDLIEFIETNKDFYITEY